MSQLYQMAFFFLDNHYRALINKKNLKKVKEYGIISNAEEEQTYLTQLSKKGKIIVMTVTKL